MFFFHLSFFSPSFSILLSRSLIEMWCLRLKLGTQQYSPCNRMSTSGYLLTGRGETGCQEFPIILHTGYIPYKSSILRQSLVKSSGEPHSPTQQFSTDSSMSHTLTHYHYVTWESLWSISFFLHSYFPFPSWERGSRCSIFAGASACTN